MPFGTGMVSGDGWAQEFTPCPLFSFSLAPKREIISEAVMETVARKSGNFRHPDTERPSFSVEPGGLEGCHTADYFAGLNVEIPAEKKGVATALNPTSLLQSPKKSISWVK